MQKFLGSAENLYYLHTINTYSFLSTHTLWEREHKKAPYREALSRDCFLENLSVTIFVQNKIDEKTAKMRSKKLKRGPRVVLHSPTPSSILWSLPQCHQISHQLITSESWDGLRGNNKRASLKSFTLTHSASIKDVATHHPVPHQGQVQGWDCQQPQLAEPRVLYSGSALRYEVFIWFTAALFFL